MAQTPKTKKQLRIDEIKYEEALKAQVELVDRGVSNASSFGNFAKPSHPLGYKFVGFEFGDGVKRPKSIVEFIMAIQYGYTEISSKSKIPVKKLAKLITADNNESKSELISQLTVQRKDLRIKSVYRDTNGNLHKYEQSSSGRGRSFEDVFVLARYFYKTITWSKFIDILARLVYTTFNSGNVSSYMQRGYACGAIKKNRVTIGGSLFNINNRALNVGFSGIDTHNSSVINILNYNQLYTNSGSCREGIYLRSSTVLMIYQLLNPNFVKKAFIKYANLPEDATQDDIDNKVFSLLSDSRRDIFGYDTKYNSKESMRTLFSKHFDRENRKPIYFYQSQLIMFK